MKRFKCMMYSAIAIVACVASVSVGSKHIAQAKVNNITISGVKENAYYNASKILKFSGSNLSKVVVNGKVDKSALKKKQLKLSKNGKNVITVYNKNGQKKKIEFYIDKKAPTITGVANNKAYTQQRTLKFNDNFGLKKVTVNGKSNQTALKTKSIKVKKQGNYEIKVTDLAGNVTTTKFRIKNDGIHKLKAANTYSQLVIVSVKNNKATVTMHIKNKNGKWDEILSTPANIEKNHL